MHNVRTIYVPSGLELPILWMIFLQKKIIFNDDRESLIKINPLTNDGTFGTGADTHETLFGGVMHKQKICNGCTVPRT